MGTYTHADHVEAFEELLKAREDYHQKLLELGRAKRTAEANQILSPELVSSVAEGLEELQSSLESFCVSPALHDLSSREVLEKDHEKPGILCPIEKRPQLVEALRSLGAINEILKESMEGLEADSLDAVAEEAAKNFNQEWLRTEELFQTCQESKDDTLSLLQSLKELQERKDELMAKNAGN